MMFIHWISVQRFTRSVFWLACALATLAGQSTLAYPTVTYAYVDNGPDGRQRSYQLMLPTDIPVIRGLLVYDGTTGDTRDDYRRTIFNEFLHLHGFGYVGSFNTSVNRGNVALNALMRGLTNFVGQSGHKELLNVPFVFWGFSGSGSYAWLYAVQFPSRTIAVCALHAGVNTNGAVMFSKAINVPITITTGEIDNPITPVSQFNFDLHRPLGALWSISTLQGVDHREVNDSALGIPFLDHMIRLRYPANQNPLNGPINLLPVAEETGWLADNSTWKSGFTYITNFASYAGNPQTASWLPDSGIANLYRAFSSFNETIKITSVGGQAVAPTAPVVLNAQSDIQIVADASAFAGWTQLDFYNQDQLLGSVTSGTPQFTLKSAPPGVYSFVVLGKNAQGAVATSQPALAIVRLAGAPVFSFVNPAGTLELTSPVAGGVINAPANIPLAAAPQASSNPIMRVDFFEGLRLIGSASAAPYSLVWSNVNAGAYEFTAKAVDSANNTATARPIRVTVSVPNNQPPTVTLTSPSAGTSFGYLSNVTLTASAADSDGQIAKVDFFIGDKLIGAVTSAPYTFVWRNPPVGEYVCTARATDNANRSTTSVPVKIKIVMPGPPPAVNLNSPKNNARFAPGAAISLSATFSGGSGSIEKVSYYRGEVLIGSVKTAPYSFNWTAVPAGNYAITAEVADTINGVGISQPALVSVAAATVNAAPNIILTSPLDGAVFDSPVDLALTVDAEDTDGTIKQVNFFQGTTLIGTATSSPFGLVWKNPSPGNYAISAQAIDNTGAATTSTPVGVMINPAFDPPPSATITSPAGSASVPPLTPVNVTVNAADPDGIARVDFFVGNSLIGTAFNPPYTLAWINPGAGTYVLNATVVDNLGASTAALPTTISVTSAPPPPNSPPSVSIAAPADHATFIAPASIPLSAAASDIDGTVRRVEFFQGTNLLGSAVQTPFDFAWINVSAGTYVLTARAFDNAGDSTVSAPITITVQPPPNQPPSVTITAPTNGAAYPAPASVPISVDANDSDGTVQNVDVFQNNLLLISLTVAPFNFTWTNAPAGNYTLIATATDNQGASATSSPVAITVTPPLPLALEVTRNGDSISLSWAGNAILESTASIPGEWVPVQGVTGNSQTVSVTAGNQFFRLRQ